MADAIVVGAGVIGLTSAIRLAEAGLDVRIRAAEPPQRTTSRAASALWGSSFAGPADDVRRWAEATLEQLRALAEVPGSGVRIARGILTARTSDEGPPGLLFPGVSRTAITSSSAAASRRMRGASSPTSTSRGRSWTAAQGSSPGWPGLG